MTDPNVEQKISYIGSRLREKSTYAGLAMGIGIVLPYLAKQFPALGLTSVQTWVDAITYLGMGAGLFISIFLPEKTVAKAVIVALAATFMLFGNPAQAQRLHVTGNLQKDIAADKADLEAKNARVQASINGGPTSPDISCDFKIFIGLTPANFEAAIKKCLSDANSTLADDTARALDSAKAYTQTGASAATPDNDAINCLTPGLALLRAATIIPGTPEVPAVLNTDGTVKTAAIPAVPAKQPGLILLFQKYREFVLSGALTACQTWVSTPVNATVVAGANNAIGAVGAITGIAAVVPK